ncbi:nitrogen fixation protein [Calothrix sp. NIES-2100]|uniref:Nif11-like leader peptide family natural product precursor n=1 Tax=Calothrix sp. NIES-2100 TaxID=1954172 RepID=UPI000B5E1FFD|nr:nitrogen fixation protein [Calothrix sp. NIES-2100]
MSLEILEKVKEFLIRLVKDEGFRTQLMSDKVDEVKKVIEDGGYNFSPEEFETATIKILELKELGEFHELTEQELIGAVGGITNIGSITIQPLYGVIVGTPKKCIRPCPKPRPWPQPLYGIVVDPPIVIDPPIAQPLYGVIIDDRPTS